MIDPFLASRKTVTKALADPLLEALRQLTMITESPNRMTEVLSDLQPTNWGKALTCMMITNRVFFEDLIAYILEERDSKKTHLLDVCRWEATDWNPRDRKFVSKALVSLIQIYIPEEKIFENLLTFIEDTRINTSRMRYYQYLLSIINLLSEICFERNYLAIEALQDIYPINLCLYIMTKPKIPYEMREVFGKLMKHLWINVTPFYKVILPNPVKTFEGLTDKIAFSQSQGRRIIYDKVKTFIPQFIHTFTQMKIIQDLKEVKLLSTLLEIML